MPNTGSGNTAAVSGEQNDQRGATSLLIKPQRMAKKRGVVSKRRRSGPIKTSMKHNPPSNRGLPSFKRRLILNDNTSTTKTLRVNVDSDDDDDTSTTSINAVEELPVESLVAIHSLIQADQGLSIPLAYNASVQAVLEHQIYATFDENNATFIHREILEMVRSNKLRHLYSQDNSAAYMLTSDYVRAVQDATNRYTTQIDIEHKIKVVSWFVNHLGRWTGIKVSESELETQWYSCVEPSKRPHTSNDEIEEKRSFQDILVLLLDMELLLRDTRQGTLLSRQESYFYFWLPQWAVVLKAWNEAAKQLLNRVAQRKEISKMNLLRQNLHSQISAQFLLNDLVYKGKLRVTERHFGKFVELVRESK